MYIEKLAGQTRYFAEACYNTNNLEELRSPHAPEDADSTDCKTWGITPDEWSQAIEVARLEREEIIKEGHIEKKMEKRVTVPISEMQWNALHDLARDLGRKTGKNVSLNSLLKEAIMEFLKKNA